jgi:hypothetical protein
MEVYKKATREKMTLRGFVEEAIVDTLNNNNEQSFRALSKHVSGWCSYNSMERQLQSHESYASYSKNIKPGLTEGNRLKQMNFSKRVHDRWGLPAHTKILWCICPMKNAGSDSSPASSLACVQNWVFKKSRSAPIICQRSRYRLPMVTS